MLLLHQLSGKSTTKRHSIGCHIDDFSLRLTQLLDRRKDWLGLHHHTGPASIGQLVGLVVLIRRPIPQLMRANVDQAVFLTTSQHTGRKKTLHHFWKEG